MLVFDVDGVMTDGSLYLDTNGELVRKMSVRDGYALKQALKTGYEVCVITEAQTNRFELDYAIWAYTLFI